MANARKMKRVNRVLLFTTMVLAVGATVVVLTGVLRPSRPASVSPIQLERGNADTHNQVRRDADRDRVLSGRGERGGEQSAGEDE
jgi:hypothetical protein